ncbi:MAG: di-trans,poly-cis-decaprenylcistransferase [Parcubacteria group bacterium RIFOXYD2_FULL_52_8]|nr:MAG: di-trans,poly-cis-decaprenylcistransferase [Parcubacteria group bacterium RIFOXYD2_FULL_52_8]
MSDTVEKNTISGPTCIGIIPDGNRRWARARGLRSIEGHEAGFLKYKQVVQWAIEANVPYLISYGFSTENWNRPQEEIDLLFSVLSKRIVQEIPFFLEQGIRLIYIGDLRKFSAEIQDALKLTMYRTREAKRLTAVIAANYGGRDELVRAINKLRTERLNLMETITEADITGALDTAGIPDPDMIIRTSGEQRVSGFLPWQSVYSELFFPSVFWPDLEKEQFMGMVDEFMRRQRRFGT